MINKLRQDNNHYYITKGKSFNTEAKFTNSVVKKIFDFAYAMAFKKTFYIH